MKIMNWGQLDAKTAVQPIRRKTPAPELDAEALPIRK